MTKIKTIKWLVVGAIAATPLWMGLWMWYAISTDPIAAKTYGLFPMVIMMVTVFAYVIVIPTFLVACAITQNIIKRVG